MSARAAHRNSCVVCILPFPTILSRLTRLWRARARNRSLACENRLQMFGGTSREQIHADFLDRMFWLTHEATGLQELRACIRHEKRQKHAFVGDLQHRGAWCMERHSATESCAHAHSAESQIRGARDHCTQISASIIVRGGQFA